MHEIRWRDFDEVSANEAGLNGASKFVSPTWLSAKHRIDKCVQAR
jgi:hypothetical protein